MDFIEVWVFAITLAVCLISLATAFYFYLWVKALPAENKKIIEIGRHIENGANTFLKREYKILAVFALACAGLILLFLPRPIWGGAWAKNLIMALSYLFGTALSAASGKIGIMVSTKANVKTAEAAAGGIKKPFLIGFRGGAVMGMGVVGISLLGTAAIYFLTGEASAVLGFSLGASSLALFAKAGGGIFTKTADISADIVGKAELGLPEDDPRNPAVIADNVGDNVGDVAGTGADLFDSNVAALAAALVMAMALPGRINSAMIFCYGAIGLLSSTAGIILARMGKRGDPTRALNRGTYITTALFIVLTAGANLLFGFLWRIWAAALCGLFAGVIIGISSDYFTNDKYGPVKKVARASKSGAAFTILSGISYGFLSVLPSMAGIAAAALSAYAICAPLGAGFALFGISMSAVGMLSIVGMIISNDAYGPIVDNARSLAEMGGLGEEALKTADCLDSAGNTAKAVTKGFAIAAAGLTIIALLGAFLTEANAAALEMGQSLIKGFDIMNPAVLFGVLTGAALPAVFSAMLILGVNKNAQRMVAEIRRQFTDIKGLREGEAAPEYEKCIDIATIGALKELIPAGAVAIFATLSVGFIGGVYAIGGFLAGNIISGLLLALFMSNTGGLWDNTKKYIEAGNEGGPGSPAHKCAIVGDTVGDPFKDTAGPSINTQVTVVSLIASIMAGVFLAFSFFK